VIETVDTEKGVPDGFFLTSNVHKTQKPRTLLEEHMMLIYMYTYKSAGLV